MSLDIPNYEDPNEVHMYSVAGTQISGTDNNWPDAPDHLKHPVEMDLGYENATTMEPHQRDEIGNDTSSLAYSGSVNPYDKDYEGPDEADLPIVTKNHLSNRRNCGEVVRSGMEHPGSVGQVGAEYEGPYGVVSLDSFRWSSKSENQ